MIYAKLSDKFGNTVYISSEGITFYEDATADTTEITYVKKSKADVTAKVTLNGNTVESVFPTPVGA